jgi:hypothetical protein
LADACLVLQLLLPLKDNDLFSQQVFLDLSDNANLVRNARLLFVLFIFGSQGTNPVSRGVVRPCLSVPYSIKVCHRRVGSCGLGLLSTLFGRGWAGLRVQVEGNRKLHIFSGGVGLPLLLCLSLVEEVKYLNEILLD